VKAIGHISGKRGADRAANLAQRDFADHGSSSSMTVLPV
jgi:hypothetical protein